MVNDVLSIDFDRQTIKAVVVKRRGRTAVVTAAKEIPAKGGMDAAEELDAVLAALGKQTTRVVAVTSGARLFTCELQVPYALARKLGDEKLKNSARWEVEPYLDFPSAEGIYSVTLVDPRLRADGTGRRSSSSTVMQVCAASKDTYEHFKQICRERGLTLQRLYGTDTAFAYAGLNGIAAGAIVDLRLDSTVVAIRRGAAVSGFRSAPTSIDAENGDARRIAQVLSESIKELSAELGQPDQIVMTGSGADIPVLQEQLAFHSGLPTSRWTAATPGNALTSKPGQLGPQFAGAIGAAMLELRLAGSTQLGVDDRTPVSAAIKAKLYLLPVIAAALAAPLIGLHYMQAKAELNRLEQKRQQLDGEVNEVKPKANELAQAAKQVAALQQSAAALAAEAEFYEQLAKPSRLPIVELLQTLSRVTPDEVILVKIEQLPPDRHLGDAAMASAAGRKQPPSVFEISGVGWDDSSIFRLLKNLQDPPHCTMLKFDFREADGARDVKPDIKGDLGAPTWEFTASFAITVE